MRYFQKILFPTVWAVSMSAACASIGFSGLNGTTFDLALANNGDLTVKISPSQRLAKRRFE